MVSWQLHGAHGGHIPKTKKPHGEDNQNKKRERHKADPGECIKNCNPCPSSCKRIKS